MRSGRFENGRKSLKPTWAVLWFLNRKYHILKLFPDSGSRLCGYENLLYASQFSAAACAVLFKSSAEELSLLSLQTRPATPMQSNAVAEMILDDGIGFIDTDYSELADVGVNSIFASTECLNAVKGTVLPPSFARKGLYRYRGSRGPGPPL